MKFVRGCFLFLTCLLLSSCSSEISTPTAIIIQTLSPAGTHVVPSVAPTTAPTVTLTPKSITSFSLDMVTGLDSAMRAALEKHDGLVNSITAEGNRQFTANVTVLSSDGQPTTSKMTVTPETMTEDLTSKNKYGDTPVMTLADGSKLYWVQEEKVWFEVKISPDINKPVFVPFTQREVAVRVVIAEFNQPFSPDAIARWNAKTGQYGIGFETHQVNARTNEWTKWAYLINRSISDPGLATNNSPIQTFNTWFTTTIPDGTSFEYYFTKWLDPADPRNPQPDEWKVMQNAIGTEISSNKQNRDRFAKDLFDVKNNAPVWFSIPIVKVDPNFFSNPNLPTILPIQQLSLNKLLGLPGNDFSQLDNPNLEAYYYKVDSQHMSAYNYKFDATIQPLWGQIDKTNPAFAGGSYDNANPSYCTNWYPPEVQTLLFPTFLMLR